MATGVVVDLVLCRECLSEEPSSEQTEEEDRLSERTRLAVVLFARRRSLRGTPARRGDLRVSWEDCSIVMGQGGAGRYFVQRREQQPEEEEREGRGALLGPLQRPTNGSGGPHLDLPSLLPSEGGIHTAVSMDGGCVGI